MKRINAIITGVGGFVPDYILNNEELSRMVDTNDEWIMTRVGIKERRILVEEGLGTSYMARKAAKELMRKTGADPDSIDALILATSTADYKFPSTASIVLGKLVVDIRELPGFGELVRSYLKNPVRPDALYRDQVLDPSRHNKHLLILLQ